MAKTIPDKKWREAADLILEILARVRADPAGFEKEAAARGIALEQLVAAAITEALRSVVFRGY
jgi:hypothetical protein